MDGRLRISSSSLAEDIFENLPLERGVGLESSTEGLREVFTAPKEVRGVIRGVLA
jgi:hypothetical protein